MSSRARPLRASSPPSASTSPSASSAVLRDEHALLAAYETRPTRPKRSSSERSKEFRAKRKKYEGELQLEVDALRREVSELNMRRNIWQEKLVHMRTNISGALVKVVREYYLVFQHGLAVNASAGGAAFQNPKTKYQLDFLKGCMDPNVLVNGAAGIPALVEMWRQYTIAHENLFVEVGDVLHFGSDEDPVVLLSTKIHAQIAPSMFEIMFPTALHDAHLKNKFVGKPVTYGTRTFFRFNADGLIISIDHDLSIVDGLLGVASSSMEDTIQLMEHFDCKPIERWNITHDEAMRAELQIKLESVEITAASSPVSGLVRKPNHRASSEAGVKKETPSSSSDDDSETERRKLTMNFLLS